MNGGIPVSLSFGEEAAMMEVQQKSTAREFSTVAILGTLALIFLSALGQRPYTVSRITLYLCLQLFVCCLRYIMG